MKKQITILGAGESGVGAALLAKKQAYEVLVSDSQTIKPNFKLQLQAANIEFEEKGHTFSRFEKSDIIIKSPGIPNTISIIQQAQNSNIPILSEIEWAARFTQKPIIAITGSNGKTTSSSLMHHILKEANVVSKLLGNIGNSFARYLAEQGDERIDVFVLELSSFQLDNIKEFTPSVAILLNLSPDHLDRYEYDENKYYASKLNLAKALKKDGILIYNLDDKILKNKIVEILPLLQERKIQIFGFSIKQHNNTSTINSTSVCREKEQLHIGNNISLPINSIGIRGKHNLSNAAAIGLAATLFGLPSKAIVKGLTTFKGLAHRLELVDTLNGVEYINDSKATNVDAVLYALDAIPAPIIWIAGGLDKGNDYTLIEDLVSEKVDALICLGTFENNNKIEHAFVDKVPLIFKVNGMIQAVETAHILSNSTHSVLLSPACASFDLFEDYQDRGNQFKEAVMQLKQLSKV